MESLSFSSSAAYAELREQAQSWIAHKTEDHRLAGLNGPQVAMREFRVNEVELDLQNRELLAANDIEADLSLRDVPIVFVTSLVTQAEAGPGLLILNGRRFLSKPFTAQALVAAVDGILAVEALPSGGN